MCAVATQEEVVNPANKDDLAQIAQFMLINLDEFGGLSGREPDVLKSVSER